MINPRTIFRFFYVSDKTNQGQITYALSPCVSLALNTLSLKMERKINKIFFIWMSHWRHWVTEGAEYWISCKPPAFLSNFSSLQLIQNSAPSVTRWRQRDIWMPQPGFEPTFVDNFSSNFLKKKYLSNFFHLWWKF